MNIFGVSIIVTFITRRIVITIRHVLFFMNKSQMPLKELISLCGIVAAITSKRFKPCMDNCMFFEAIFVVSRILTFVAFEIFDFPMVPLHMQFHFAPMIVRITTLIAIKSPNQLKEMNIHYV